MSAVWLYALGSVILVSLLSLLGIVLFLFQDKKLESIIFFLVSLAAGSLFGDAFIHLLPEAYKHADFTLGTSLYALAGIFIFFILEKFIRWRHVHAIHFGGSIHPIGYTNLIGDGIHNFIDGIIIGAAYLASLQVGVATTIAVILHEIPHEISDYGLLLYAGFSKMKALLLNFLSASLAILGTLISLYAGSDVPDFSSIMLPITAGGFIYIAGSDLLPELHKEIKVTKSLLQLAAIILGIGLMLFLVILA